MFIQHSWKMQHPDSWPSASHSLSSGSGSSGDGCCPLGAIGLWCQNPGHGRCFLLCHCCSVLAELLGSSGGRWVRLAMEKAINQHEECSWMSCWGQFSLGPHIPLVLGKNPTGLLSLGFSEGKTRIPLCLLFLWCPQISPRHGSWVCHLVRPSHQKMHWVQVCSLLHWNCTGRSQLATCFPALTPLLLPDFICISSFMFISNFMFQYRNSREKKYLEKRTMEKLQFSAFFLLLAKQLREIVFIQMN